MNYPDIYVGGKGITPSQTTAAVISRSGVYISFGRKAKAQYNAPALKSIHLHIMVMSVHQNPHV
jgi:hypothetical protein